MNFVGSHSGKQHRDELSLKNSMRPMTSGSPAAFQFYHQNVRRQDDTKGAPVLSMSADRSGVRHHKSSSSNVHASGKLENYTIGKAIGQGAYAIVHQCQHKQTMKKYAIKIYQKAKLNDSMKRKAVQREILALRKIDHPNIIKMHDLIETSKEICIVTDYIRGISLHQFVKQQCTNRQVKEPTCRRFFK
eukprot:CAMPEP_0170487396 /NCGR_PEP_ID=MMETSP0208-20121228/6218_1 /TAXON_ID=197538 /ORGANISM="Strombidium inclinatum, Strain S3" /LENGTH=188 /DNA_ID=CAMNT_0010761661 /DNA_START=1347 /DNA_END=1913 /DNA_ORIENTATION=+